MTKKSVLGDGLIWFGAAVSIAEILAGSALAPLGFFKAVSALVIGHLIGGTLLYCAGLIGAKYSVSAMEGVKRSFGQKGGLFFAVLNVIQLAGWTSVMIAAGAQSARGILSLPTWVWSCISGALILVWIALKTGELKKINTAAVSLLFLLSLLLGFIVFRGDMRPVAQGSGPALSFGDALELSIAMPVSWLPLVADYTCTAERPRLASLFSAGIYILISGWMYLIGIGAALYAGESDITLILKGAGLGIPALLIVVFSTVTTTYLDVYSSGVSMKSICGKIPPLVTEITVCILGVLLAVFSSPGGFEKFLYWIGSVFAPMIAIQITDFFIIKRTDGDRKDFCFDNLILWAIGFLLYRLLFMLNPVCGSTVPVMILMVLFRIGYVQLMRMFRKKSSQ